MSSPTLGTSSSGTSFLPLNSVLLYAFCRHDDSYNAPARAPSARVARGPHGGTLPFAELHLFKTRKQNQNHPSHE
jgi:hypothetical protein